MRFCLLLFFVGGILTRGIAQDTLPQQMERLLELVAEQKGDEELDLSQLTLLLKGYLNDPLNLNKANDEELEELQVLSSIQIQLFRAHLEKHGPLLSVYELQSIDGWDEQTIRSLLPFVTVNENPSAPSYTPGAVIRDGKHELIFRSSLILEDQTGFSSIDSATLANSLNSRYAGDPYRLYARYRFTFGNRVSVGLTAEKDPGEVFLPNLSGPNHSFYRDSLNHYQPRGFDYYSAHFFVRTSGIIRALAIGDFQAGFGQGLVAWSGLAYGKNPDGIGIKRSAGGLKPHTGTDENLFLRGAGITLGMGKFESTLLFSYKNVDANLSLDTTGGAYDIQFTSLQTSGYHSTLAELADRKSLTEMVFGGNVRFQTKKMKLGVTALRTDYELPLSEKKALYQQFQFSGTRSTNVGFDYAYILRNMNLFGEAAMHDAGGLAVVNGLVVSADPRLSFSILHRLYARGYYSAFSNAISENSTASNETGVYFGLNMRLYKNVSLSGYFDKFTSPWLKYQVSSPSEGYETISQLTWQPARKTELYLRFRHREKTEDRSNGNLDQPAPVIQENLRFNISHQINPSFRIKTRIEYLQIRHMQENEKETGFLLAQDVYWKPLGSKWSLSGRYCIFETDSYDTRTYIYENDLPGSYSIPALYDTGTRTYLNISCDITRHIEVMARWAQTWYAHRDAISEGSLTEIHGNTKTEAKVMLRMKW